jgi:hypothetical protein
VAQLQNRLQKGLHVVLRSILQHSRHLRDRKKHVVDELVEVVAMSRAHDVAGHRLTAL